MDDTVLEKANEELSRGVEKPIPLEQFVEDVFEDPQISACAAQYLLNAVESLGTRSVMERGEEVERYNFFDDPHNNGKYAIIGNTKTLNNIVSHIRRAANGNDTKIVWLTGPTATGKSELKRCLIKGLNEYSKTEEGKRYVCEWNVSSLNSSGSGQAFGESDAGASVDEDEWYQSPVQTNPLACLPDQTREDVIEQLNEESEQKVTSAGLDPFSEEAFEVLQDYYATKDDSNLFSKITDTQHFRVKRYKVDAGQGVGVLQSEDMGSTKEKLAGSWIPSLLQQLPSRGRRNPQAFSYDGVLSQGNNGLSIVEDASQHLEMLSKLLNVPEENKVRLDKQTAMELDTFMMLISNPDLEGHLNQNEQAGQYDPMKAFKRRLDKYEFKYLLSVSSEVELLRRELLSKKEEKWGEDYEEKMQEGVEVNNTYLEPHTLEVIAMASVISRISPSEKTGPNELTNVEKALLYERGYHEEDGEKKYLEDFSFEIENEGETGIPVTLTRDMLSSLDTESSVLPFDALEELMETVTTEPVISEQEEATILNREREVREYMYHRLGEDVRKAILRSRSADEESVEEYVEMLDSDRSENTESEKEKEDRRLKLKVFEKNHLGFTDEDYLRNGKPKQSVRNKREQILNSIDNYIWKNKDEAYSFETYPIREIPVLDEILGVYEWSDIEQQYEDLSAGSWDDPIEGTETENIKNTCIKNLQEMYDYTEDGAEKVSSRVIERVLT
jgi:predicted Ser/Thr protein kinase